MRNYLFYRFLVFSVLLVSSLTFATPRIIIKNATLIDAVNPVRENMTVVLQGDVIQLIAESGSVTIDTDHTVSVLFEARGRRRTDSGGRSRDDDSSHFRAPCSRWKASTRLSRGEPRPARV